MSQLIPVGNKIFTEVDDEDVVYLCLLGSWFLQNKKDVKSNIICVYKQKRLIMSHEICKRIGYKDFEFVDHKDLNRLNMKRENLRPCTRSQNTANQHINPRNKIGYKWVIKVGNRYRAVIHKDRKDIRIGYYYSPELAHYMAKLKAKELFEEFMRSE